MAEKLKTTADLFSEITSMKEVTKKLSDEVVESFLPVSKFETYAISDDEFDIEFSVSYGGCEGTVMRLYAVGSIGSHLPAGKYLLGTVKTLRVDKQALRILSDIGAVMMAEGTEHIRKVKTSLEREGYRTRVFLSGYDEAGVPLFWHKNLEKAREALDDWFMRQDDLLPYRVEIIDLKSQTAAFVWERGKEVES